jgi:hypothetical protein
LLIETLTQMMLRPVFVFSPWERLSVVFQLPVAYKNFAEETEGGASTRVRPVGLGDVDLGARLFLLDRKDAERYSWHRFGLTIGSTLPTGTNDAKVNGFRLDEHAQLGTGATAPYAGALYAFSRDPWNFFGALTGKYPFTNSYAYQYGAALLLSFTCEYHPVDAWSFGIGVDGRYALRDVHDGRTQNNTGGLVLAAAPAVKVNLSGGLWLIARAQVPFVTHLFGEQSVGPAFMSSVQYTFE